MRLSVQMFLLVVVAAAAGLIDIKGWIPTGGHAAIQTVPAQPLPAQPHTVQDGRTGGEPAPDKSARKSSDAAWSAVTATDRFARQLPDTTLSVAVLDRKTGELADGASANALLYSASLVKLVVAVDILQRRHSGLPVADQDEDLIRRALGLSDDDAMNDLWGRFDGPGAVSRVAQQLGLTETRPPDNPMQWGETVTSAHDFARLFSFVLSGLPPQDRDLIMSSLAQSPPIAAGGFDQDFGLVSRPHKAGIPAAAKPGWMCCQDARITLHSVGTVGSQRYVVALLSSQPSTLGYDAAMSALTEAADRTLDELGE